MCESTKIKNPRERKGEREKREKREMFGYRENLWDCDFLYGLREKSMGLTLILGFIEYINSY